MKVLKIFLVLFVILSMVGLLRAQYLQTGTIRGTITDNEGVPLPGVKVTVSGPSLIGIMDDISAENGTYRITPLPPGTYTILGELEGFQSVRREEVVVRVGTTVEITLPMAPATISEEVTVIAPSPTVDVQRTKITTVLDTESLRKLPLDRTVDTILSIAPGTIGGYYSGIISSATIVHGGTHISNNLQIDGVNANDPSDHGTWYTEIQYDALEEAEVVTGGLPAQVGSTSGSLFNVVTKSGGNDFHGSAQVYYTGEDLAQFMVPDEYLKSFGLGKPAVDRYNVDTSGILGGPVIRDKIWFFSSLGYKRNDRRSPFIPTTILGKSYDQYPVYDRYWIGFFKLTGQISKSLRSFVQLSYIDYNRPFGGGSTTGTKEAQTDYSDKRIRAYGNLNWLIGPDTFMELRGGTGHMIEEDRPQSGMENSATFRDAFTGYSWGAPGRQRDVHRINTNATLSLTHFVANLLGGDHEFAAGIEYQYLVDDWDWYKPDPLELTYYDGNIHYYRGLYGIDGPHPTLGDGRVAFRFCSPALDGSVARGETRRWGAYIQDSWTIKNRLTLNLGLRFDREWGYMPDATKIPSAGVAFDIGAYYYEPLYGFNPFGEMHMDEWKDAMKWTILTPRIGINYDVFGDGRTSLRASFSIYAEGMPVMYYQTIHPWREWSMSFNWWDLNNNGITDPPPIDEYQQYGGKSAIEMAPSYYRERLDTEYKAPTHTEYTVGIQQELFKDFRVGLQYIYQKKSNAVDTVLYDPISSRYWYTYELASNWWVPFTTTVPAVDEYPEQTFTMYFMSYDAPWDEQFTRFANVPESKRNYNAVEITFDKRFSQGWSLGGSLVLSRTKANNSGSYGAVWGYGGAYNDANWFVNRYGKDEFDRPFVLKLYGTFTLPYRFIVGFYATSFPGSAYQRTVYVVPPAAWAEANNCAQFGYTVNAETQGTRRNQSVNNVDFRIEKEFGLQRFGRVSLYVDVFNLLGSSYFSSSWDPGGTWYPDDANTKEGRFVPGYWYGKVRGVSGQRIFKFSIRYTF